MAEKKWDVVGAVNADLFTQGRYPIFSSLAEGKNQGMSIIWESFSYVTPNGLSRLTYQEQGEVSADMEKKLSAILRSFEPGD